MNEADDIRYLKSALQSVKVEVETAIDCFEYEGRTLWRWTRLRDMIEQMAANHEAAINGREHDVEETT